MTCLKKNVPNENLNLHFRPTPEKSTRDFASPSASRKAAEGDGSRSTKSQSKPVPSKSTQSQPKPTAKKTSTAQESQPPKARQNRHQSDPPVSHLPKAKPIRRRSEPPLSSQSQPKQGSAPTGAKASGPAPKRPTSKSREEVITPPSPPSNQVHVNRTKRICVPKQDSNYMYF